MARAVLVLVGDVNVPFAHTHCCPSASSYTLGEEENSVKEVRPKEGEGALGAVRSRGGGVAVVSAAVHHAVLTLTHS